MESDVEGGGGGTWYQPHDLLVYSYNNLLSAPSQVVAGNLSHAEKTCWGSNAFGG